MKLDVYNLNHNIVSKAELSDPVVLCDSAMTQALDYLRSSSFYSISHSKDRSEVSGSGIKPWRQKGTGNARAGSRRSPLWRGGGITFGPLSVDNHTKRIPSKLLKSSAVTALVNRIATGNVAITDEISVDKISTSNLYRTLGSFGLANGTLIICNASPEIVLSARNISGLTLKGHGVNALDILSARNIIISLDMLKSFFADIKTTETSTTKASKPATSKDK